MAMRLDYVVRETSNNLLRNLLLTVASIITFGVSLGILGGALLFVAGVDHAFERWKDGVEFIVYMQPGADQEKIDQVKGKLAASPQVSDIKFVDTGATFKEFQQLFRDDPDIVASVKPQDLPQSFRVTPTNPQSNVVSELGQSFQNEPGVYKVEFALDAVKQMERFLKNLSTFFIVLAVVLLMATALLIVFMIQTGVFARRREIEVQRLVGATNWFIRIPFILEGVVHAIIGWAAATAGLWGLTWVWRTNFVNKDVQSFFGAIWWTDFNVLVVMGLLIVVALVVGAIGSTLSVSWYLKT